jgi:hypothetical protein
MTNSLPSLEVHTRDRNVVGVRLAHGHRFAGQQRFVDGEVEGMHQNAVRRDPVPLRKQQDVAADHFPPGDAHLLSAADDVGARAREIFQRLERSSVHVGTM